MGAGGALAGSTRGSTAERAVTAAARPVPSRPATAAVPSRGRVSVPPLPEIPPDFPKGLFLKIFWDNSQKGFI